MMLRNYNQTLGSYTPAFFHINLNFPFYQSRLALYNLKKKDLSTFVHEYIHFLQDISSYSLLNNAYVYSEYMHAAAHCIYKYPKGVFQIPLKIPRNYGNIDLNRFVNTTCMGDFSDRDNIFVKKVVFHWIRVPFHNDIVNILPIPFLLLASGDELKFGTCAIMESMAYLIERKITKGSTLPKDYPYRTATAVVDLEYPEFGQDELNVIALCDMSLQYANPGKIFVETLREMKTEGYLPAVAEDIYDYMYKIPIEQMGEGTTFQMGIARMGMMVQDRLKLYLNDTRFKPFHDTIRNYIGTGVGKRLSNPHFMIDLVRDGYALYNNTLRLLMNKLGTPVICDSRNEYSQIPQAGHKANESLQYFLGVEQIYKCFNEGSTICELYEFCEYTKNHGEEIFGEGWQDQVPLLDDNCWQSPWLKVNDVRLCPYALLWRHWNLGEWRPES